MALPPPSPRATCLITGASSGIGTEIARELARRGHGVTLVARRTDRLRTLADELEDAYRVRAEVVTADVSDGDARTGLVNEMAQRELTVDVLVNNAGFTTMGPVHLAERARELLMLRTDVEAVADLCTLFVPGMVERRRGAILNTASTAAFQPLPGQAGYGASKAFVLSYSEALATEVKDRGVTVTALCPGPVATGFAESAGMTDDEVAGSLPRFMWVPADVVARAGIAGLEAGRSVVIPGNANKVGAAAAHLLPNRLFLGLLARQHPALKDSSDPRQPTERQ